MKIGLSTYSLVDLIKSGEMSVLDAIQWIADNGGKHVEVVPFGFDLVGNDELIEAIKGKAKEVGLDISKKLGVKLMRHDVSAFTRPVEENTIKNFERDLPKMVRACRRIADHAAQYGITTTVENHGFYVNGSDRILRLIEQVDRPNYRVTLDIGNFMCVDEDSLIGIKKLLPYTAMVHLKDFYTRYPDRHPGEGKWFITNHGNLLRGAIVGQGEIDIWKALKMIKDSGYDGYIAIEFEGMEESKIGSKIGMDNAVRIWNEI